MIRTPAPVTTDSYLVGLDQEYRLPNDEENVIRIKQNPPSGFGRKIFDNISVAGVSDSRYSESVDGLVCGQGRRLTLQREPENQYDKNAVAVIAAWTSEGTERTGQIGYLPKEAAREIAEKYAELPIGASLHILYMRTSEKSAGLRINVWIPKVSPASRVELPFDETIPMPDDPVERNLRGIELEKQGLIENAILMYQRNVEESVSGTHPYMRLATIYRKRKAYDKEVEVLQRAISVYQHTVPKGQVGRRKDMEAFRGRLEKAKALLGS